MSVPLPPIRQLLPPINQMYSPHHNHTQPTTPPLLPNNSSLNHYVYYQPVYTPSTGSTYHPGHIIAAAPPQHITTTSASSIIPQKIQRCQRCGITETPEWRRGPNGARTLCNACGLFHAKILKRDGPIAALNALSSSKIVKRNTPRRKSAIRTSPPQHYFHPQLQPQLMPQHNLLPPPGPGPALGTPDPALRATPVWAQAQVQAPPAQHLYTYSHPPQKLT